METAMTTIILETGAERFVTAGGVTITRERHEQPYEGAIDAYVDGLNSRRGAVFSSNYEYPGRYTRWDTAIIDPPLVISARGRTVRIEALNGRGEVLLPVIGKALAGLAEVTIAEASKKLIRLDVAKPGRVFTEEERSRVPSVFTVLRAITALFKTEEDANLGLYGAFGYDLAFQFDPVDYKLERKQSQRDLVLFLPDEILVVDHYSTKAWTAATIIPATGSRPKDCRATPPSSRSRAQTVSRRAATMSRANMRTWCAGRWRASSAATCSRSCPARCFMSAARPSPPRFPAS
ncbi:hypothetical protein AJ88_48995 [Mesorhizobium amorphae CCBAU 01583]|nr:hypothetical protein AJ88_48995 [Mesorhizobium amorphae CCBAU 01583]